jgi:hypothetical protein
VLKVQSNGDGIYRQDAKDAKDAKDDLKENGGQSGVNTVLPFLALLASWR